MLRGISRIPQRILTTYRSEEFRRLVRGAHRYLHSKLHERIRESRLFRGERQFAVYTELRHRYHSVRYAAPADPTEPIWVDPERVDWYIMGIYTEWGLGRIKGGDWDRSSLRRPLDELPVYRGVKQRFEDGKDWEDTDYVEYAKRKFERGPSRTGYDDVHHFFAARCAYVDALFEAIRTDGYRPNSEGGHDVAYERSYKNTRDRYQHRLEPLVVIGRNGEISLRDGFHRLVIAEVLGIDAIPFNVIMRHRAWQRIRDEIARASDPSALSPDLQRHLGHPDLADIVPVEG